jgi:hypothetical protein
MSVRLRLRVSCRLRAGVAVAYRPGVSQLGVDFVPVVALEDVELVAAALWLPKTSSALLRVGTRHHEPCAREHHHASPTIAEGR